MPSPVPPRRRFVLLDRDGTIIVEKNYLRAVKDLELLPHAAEGLRLFRTRGFGLIVITNQSGVGRGLVSIAAVEEIHAELARRLEAEGVPLEAIYYCPHLPSDNCNCRKPRIGLAERAAGDFGFELGECLVIGDKVSDVEFGRACDARTILVRTGYGTLQESLARPDAVADNLEDAASLSLRLEDGNRMPEHR